jgi:GAF domain-containing protein
MDTAHRDDLFDRLGHPRRMRALARYDLLGPALPARLDPICARTAERLNAPVSLISVILDSAQFILGSHGLPAWVSQSQGIPAEWAMCTHTVLAGAPYCVSDATADPVHADNPLLPAEGLRSYAGVPLTDGDGHVLGAHCVLDTAARTFTDQDLEVLHEGAREAMQSLLGGRTDDDR